MTHTIFSSTRNRGIQSLSLSLSLSLYAILASASLFAQDSPTAEQLKKQIPTTKAGVENTLETTKEAIKPLISDPARVKKLAEMRRKALLVTKNSADFQRLITEGKTHPWGELANQYPAMQKKVQDLSYDYNILLREKNPLIRPQLEKALLAALQPIGPFLVSADPETVDLSLSSDQVTELKDLTYANRESSPDSKDSLTALSPISSFTLLNIGFPIKIGAPANTEIYLSSGGGGMFPNGLAMQKIKSNAEGIAETTWISKGDSIDLSVINVSSPQTNNTISLEIEVVQLKLRKLPELPDVATKLKLLKAKALREAKQSKEELLNSPDTPEPTDPVEIPEPDPTDPTQ